MPEETRDLIERTRALIAEMEALVLRAKRLLVDQKKRNDKPPEPAPERTPD